MRHKAGVGRTSTTQQGGQYMQEYLMIMALMVQGKCMGHVGPPLPWPTMAQRITSLIVIITSAFVQFPPWS